MITVTADAKSCPAAGFRADCWASAAAESICGMLLDRGDEQTVF